MNNERIFILDDENRISDLCARVLERRGYRVIAPPYGPDALEEARRGQYDLLLTDYRMPDLNGIELYRQVRETNAAVVCTLVTAHATADVITDALSAGVDAFVPKPFTADELVRGVECALAKGRLQRENAWLKRVVSLLELHIRIAMNSDPQEVFDIATEVVGHRIGADRVSLLTRTEDPGSLRIAAARGLPEEFGRGARADTAGTVAGYVLENGTRVMINDRQAPPEVCQCLRFAELGSGMCVPLRRADRNLGVLTASLSGGSPRRFDETDLNVLAEIAESIAELGLEPITAETLRANCFKRIESVVCDIDGRDYFSKEHSCHVARYAERIAQELGLPENRVEEVRIAGLLHDVGKVGLPERIVRAKAIPVSEIGELRTHVVHGEEILRSTGLPEKIRKAVRHHHERFDGGGYPEGLRGEEIPLDARILAVADTLDAITSDRQYRPRLRPEGVREELKRVRGFQLDPVIVDKALELYGRGGLLPPDHPHARELS